MKLFLLCALFFQMSLQAEDLPGDSLYQIESKWSTQDGREIELKDLRGKPTILAMVYFSCKYVCPIIISSIQNLESKLNKKIKNQTQVLLISFDPEKDTPLAMAAYAEKAKLDMKRWTLMTNKKEEKIRELAAALSFKYEKKGEGDYTHSFMIFVLDKDGVIKAKIDSAGQDKATLVDALNKMSL
jgi:protein SCO1